MARKNIGKKTVMCVYKTTQVVDTVDEARKNFTSQVAGGMSRVECFDMSSLQDMASYFSMEEADAKKEYEEYSKKLNAVGLSIQAKAVELMANDENRHSREMKSIAKSKTRR